MLICNVDFDMLDTLTTAINDRDLYIATLLSSLVVCHQKVLLPAVIVKCTASVEIQSLPFPSDERI